ncbi:MAG TPA: bifunctional pyr operon transcriptional regulator/uracil phosphoribosyltransferase PyrR [Sutterella sp.]|nr:bifunctional pyr operon transcriptional regulator/uracil phosphoribosyltransferase PyrR [Sutterella sp.]
MRLKANILTQEQVTRSLTRITHEIIEKNPDLTNVVLLGIKSRGVPLAFILARSIANFGHVEVEVGSLDTKPYRDDLEGDFPDTSEIAFDIAGKDVIIVDDVLFTGRTVRAAIDAVFKLARPKTIQLAVLIDRGHRELPIRPDFVGKNIPTARSESVSVKLPEPDGECGVYLYGPD